MAEQRIIETAPGIRLSVRVEGEGPLIILMHGWPELGLSWRHQIGPLADAGFTVAVPDMRGYGASSCPPEPDRYTLDELADDMSAVAKSLGAERWLSVGHDWGAGAAWRCALRFPNEVAGVFCLSVPYTAAPPMSANELFELMWPDRFFYARYFQQPGCAEAELEADVRASLKKMFFVLSGDAPKDEWIVKRPKQGPMLPGMVDPPEGPLSFMSDIKLDEYARAYAITGFRSTINWYRNLDASAAQARAYPDEIIRQPSGFLTGDREIVISMNPGIRELQGKLLADLRVDLTLPGAGHWPQQERPDEVNEALIGFVREVFG